MMLINSLVNLHARRGKRFNNSKYGGGSRTFQVYGMSYLHERRENYKHGSRSQFEGSHLHERRMYGFGTRKRERGQWEELTFG